MKAAIWHDKKNVEVKEMPIPIAGANDVIVKVTRAGICGTDKAAYFNGGESVGYFDGAKMGHELVGVVYLVGSKVPAGIKEGMRVFVNPTRATKAGLFGAVTAGAFAEYMLVEDAQLEDNLFPIPDSVSDDVACVGEPVSVAVHAIRKCLAKPGEKAVVFGTGPIAMSLICGLRGLGIKDVVAVDSFEDRLVVAKKMGAKICNMKTEDLKESLIKSCGSFKHFMGYDLPDVDMYFDAMGSGTLLDTTMDMVRPGARVAALSTYHEPKQLINVGNIMMNEVALVGSCGYATDDIKDSLRIVGNPDTHADAMITHHFSLDDINKAFEMTQSRTETPIKIVLDIG